MADWKGMGVLVVVMVVAVVIGMVLFFTLGLDKKAVPSETGGDSA